MVPGRLAPTDSSSLELGDAMDVLVDFQTALSLHLL